MKRAITHLGAAAVICIATGCSSSTGVESKGTLIGGISPAGSTAPASYFEGEVEVLQHGKTVASQEVSILTTREFRFRLSPGSYRLRGTVGQFRPGACVGDATVVAGKVTRADAVCPAP